MKGLQQRFRERQKTQQGRRTAPAMATYAEALRTVSESTGGRSYRQGDGALVQRLKPGVVYAVKTPDSDAYYRTVLLKKVPMTGAFQILISNAVYGTIPPGIDEVPQEQVFKQMRDINASLVSDAGKDLRAAPYEYWGPQ